MLWSLESLNAEVAYRQARARRDWQTWARPRRRPLVIAPSRRGNR